MERFELDKLRQGDELILFKQYDKKSKKYKVRSCYVVTAGFVKNSFNEIIPIHNIKNKIRFVIRSGRIIAKRKVSKEVLDTTQAYYDTVENRYQKTYQTKSKQRRKRGH